MNLISVFIFGIGILVGALILNFIASGLGLMSWYDFIKEPGRENFLSYLWLFIIYPFGLGLTAFILSKFINL